MALSSAVHFFYQDKICIKALNK